MAKKAKNIKVNSMSDNFAAGISIEKVFFNDVSTSDNEITDGIEDSRSAHREDRHSFFLLESGTVEVEIDFQKHIIERMSVIYMHPDRVHRILSLKDVTVSSWAVNNENLDPEYLKLLEDIRDARPLILSPEIFSVISEAVALCIKIAKRKNDKLYRSLLKHSCNTLVALVVSQYLELAPSINRASRVEIITRSFKRLLENDYATSKKPADYAGKLNISPAYLNECIKNTTGYTVSQHLQQRVILEAKRLLFHSDRSVQEISVALGYDDYAYFSRLFTKVTGLTALAFRNTNLD
jgi:AraC family transcriptional activator of pobA